MYSLFKQIHPPTGIEHCVYCNFFYPWERNLVVAGVNQLHVYRLNAEPELVDGDGEEKPGEKKTRLECLASFSLHGNVMSLQSVKLAGAQRDALLLSFAEAKLSVVEYDPSTNDLKTLSLHQFEESEMRGGTMFSQAIPTVRVDPDGRCAAVLIYGSRLVVLPFRRDALHEDLDPTINSSKSPIMSSYVIDLRQFDEKIMNIADFQFLHGYYEPTVFLLYEPLMTWSGRVAVRTDTYSIVAISLNIQQKVHPIIWSVASLPFDCFKALAVPKPIGGALVFANNSLLYLNQSVPVYAVSLNSIAESCSNFPFKIQEGVKMSLDCLQATFLSPERLVLSLKGGELYVLTLMVDGMRSVRSFHFDKAASSVLTTCMCVCEDGYLFLGSRLGNSLLLKYTEKDLDQDSRTEADRKTGGEPVSKRKRLEGSEQLASDISEIENLDELEVYGSSETQSGTTITSYTFEVCDNIWNIAPCGQAALGEPAFLSEEFTNTLDPDLELVTTSGCGKNGALSVLQKSIRPQVVTTFQLEGCIDMWTVFSSKAEPADAAQEGGQEEDGDAPDIKNGHAYLILSRPESSMVLQTGREIMELDHSGFSTATPTVFAGNMGQGAFILQVSPHSIILLEGVRQLQMIPLEREKPIVACALADPYVTLLLEDGNLMFLTLKQDSYGSGVRLAVTRPQIPQHSRCVAVSAYRDVSGLFTVTSTTGPEEVKPTAEKAQPAPDKSVSLEASNIDDEDELLYGDTDTSVFASSFEKPQQEDNVNNAPERKKDPTYWSLVARASGVLEVYSLPDFKLCYYVKNFAMGNRILVDSGHSTDFAVKASTSATDKPGGGVAEMPQVQELLMVGLGHNRSHPHLLAMIKDELFVYEAFPYHGPQDGSITGGHLKLRFRKVPHSLMLQPRAPFPAPQRPEDGRKHRPQSLRCFSDISGYAGVFVCGPYPHWLFMTSRGSLRLHPMNIDGQVTCFTPFHNINCPNGFLYFNTQGELRICVLPTHVTYDAPWPIRKVPLRCTPHFVSYHSESKIYAVVTSTPEVCNKAPKTTTDEREWDLVEKDERFIFPTVDRFSLQLFSPTTWEPIPNTKFDLEFWEHVTCLKVVMLKSEGTLSGLKGYVAIGTSYCLGEEVTSRGRVLIFEVIEVVPEPGQPLTKTRHKEVYNKEQKGPVTALADVNGYLMTAIGQKLYIWTLKDNDLSGVAFIDTHIYIHSLSTIKNLILAGDLLKSVTLYRYQEDLKVLSLVSRNIRALEVYATEFLVDGNTLSFLVSDRNRNLMVYMYQPEARESHGGQRLLRRADFNVGSHINTMFRVRCRLSCLGGDKKSHVNLEKRHITFFATLDGSLGYLAPISEKVYRRLQMLQSAMMVHVPHTAGLNPKAYRTMKLCSSELTNPLRNIVDGELVWRYLSLAHNEQLEVARRIGTTHAQLMEDIFEVETVTAHF